MSRYFIRYLYRDVVSISSKLERPSKSHTGEEKRERAAAFKKGKARDRINETIKFIYKFVSHLNALALNVFRNDTVA